MAPRINISKWSIILLGLLFLLPFIRPKEIVTSRFVKKVVRTDTLEIRVTREERCTVSLDMINNGFTKEILIYVRPVNIYIRCKYAIGIRNLLDVENELRFGGASSCYPVAQPYFGIPYRLGKGEEDKGFIIGEWVDLNSTFASGRLEIVDDKVYHQAWTGKANVIAYPGPRYGKEMEKVIMKVWFIYELPCKGSFIYPPQNI